VVNKTELAAPLGMSVPGIGKWLDVLHTTQQILVVPPYFENLGKRLVKSPKIYLADSGLACHLLGVDGERELARSPFAGALFEGWVAAEIAKSQSNAGRRVELYWFRDMRGLEVDFVVPRKGAVVELIEAKLTASPTPAMARPMLEIARVLKSHGHPHVEAMIVHRKSISTPPTQTLAPGVRAMTDAQFFDRLAGQ
ncbi:MAG TPA: DUF4143 domain-containing protein, partial [Polyangia bacterium]|nr:DUF4143 domain-containing protein [Polyangia bacterium]